PRRGIGMAGQPIIYMATLLLVPRIGRERAADDQELGCALYVLERILGGRLLPLAFVCKYDQAT
ncbi:MAG: hypothetical protein ACRD4F_04950, partial [Candidatus Angelobacter sp.]